MVKDRSGVRRRVFRRVGAVLAGLVAASAVTGCASLGGIGSVVKKPTAQVTSARLEKLSFDRAQIGIDVKVTNPNPVGLSLAGFTYTFYVNDTQFLTGDFSNGLSISAGGSSTVHVPVGFEYEKLISSVSSLADRKETPYRVELTFAFDVPVLGRVKIPVNAEGTLPVVRLPSLHLAAIEVTKLSLSGASTAVRLRLNNPNPFALVLRQLDYRFTVNGRDWAKTAAEPTLTVASGTESTIEIPITLDFGSVGRSVMELLAGGTVVDYRFAGTMRLGTAEPLLPEASLPVDLSGSAAVFR